MSADVDHFYVQRSEPIAPLLPRDVRWEDDGDGELVAVGGEDEWLLFVADPEPVEQDEIPVALRDAVPDLRFQIAARVEPAGAPDAAWRLLDAVLDAIGPALGGATYDPRSGHTITWRGGERVRVPPRP